MAESSAISWCDSTWNPWVGCTKVGPACDFCYAEKWAERAGREGLWAGKRERTKTWNDPLKWQRHADFFFQIHKRRQRIFTCSLADFLDNEVPSMWRVDAWARIRDCDRLEWYIVSKRVPNFLKMLPSDWCEEKYRHVVLIATVVTQAEYDRDRERLAKIKALYPWLRVGLSMEPLIERVDMGTPWPCDWVIVGGESGLATARECRPEWCIEILDWCEANGVAFHFKQIGHNHAGWPGKIAGKGDYPAEWPKRLRVQEFPKEIAA